jgi:phosphoglycerate dehydrogenase-like enzyme
MSEQPIRVVVLNAAAHAERLAELTADLPVAIEHDPFAITWDEIAGRRSGVIEEITPATDSVRERLRQAQVVFGFGLPLGTDELAPALRWVETPATGFDQLNGTGVLDGNIAVTTIGGLFAPWVSEHVFALLFALCRRLDQFHDSQRKATWQVRPVTGLAGKTIAIVGLGNIGSAVARTAKSFGMHVLGMRRTQTRPADVDELFRPDQLHAMLGRADVVVLAVAGNDHTRNLIGAPELQAMPEHALLINVARGIVVDEPALVAALAGGHIGGAGLDTFVEEPLPADHPLWSAPNAILTPHIAPNVPEKLARCVEHFAANLRRYCDGDELLDLVSGARGEERGARG